MTKGWLLKSKLFGWESLTGTNTDRVGGLDYSFYVENLVEPVFWPYSSQHSGSWSSLLKKLLQKPLQIPTSQGLRKGENITWDLLRAVKDAELVAQQPLASVAVCTKAPACHLAQATIASCKVCLQRMHLRPSWLGAWQQAGRNGTGTGAVTSFFTKRREGEKTERGIRFSNLKATSDTAPPTRKHLLILPKRFHQIQRPILTQTNTIILNDTVLYSQKNMDQCKY